MTDTISYRPMSGESWRDPYPLYTHLREHDPVHRAPGGYWVLTRFAHVFAAARDTATFSSEQGLTFANERDQLGLLPTIVMLDPPDHTWYRRLVSRGFTPRQVGELEPDLRAYVRSCLDRLASADKPDLIDGLARPVPCWVVAHYLGVDEADRERFGVWTEALVQASGSGTYATAATALGELYAYFTEQIERRRLEPGDDLISKLLAAGPDEAGLSVEEILGYMFVMIAGGNDTAIGLLGGGAELLSRHPDQRDRLAADPSLIPTAVEECLRLTSPVQGLCRVTTRPVTVDDTVLPEGSRVLLCYAAANCDPREFGPDADRFDSTRHAERHLSFGSGAHFCLGASVARLQGRVVFEELLARWPRFEVDGIAGTYADGTFTRRYRSLPFRPGPR